MDKDLNLYIDEAMSEYARGDYDAAFVSIKMSIAFSLNSIALSLSDIAWSKDVE